MFKNFKKKKLYRLWDNAVKYCRLRQTTDDNMVHAQYTLDTKGYRNTLRICNTYWFSVATMVARTRLSVMLYVHCPSCSFIIAFHLCTLKSYRAFLLLSCTHNGSCRPRHLPSHERSTAPRHNSVAPARHSSGWVTVWPSVTRREGLPVPTPISFPISNAIRLVSLQDVLIVSDVIQTF